jgi:hypothetical protein
MRNNSRFAVPAEQRVAEAREETRRKEEAKHQQACGHPECPLGTTGGTKAPATRKTTTARKPAEVQTRKVAEKATGRKTGKKTAKAPAAKKKPARKS